MVFSDLEFHAVSKAVKLFVDSMRPPAHIRNQFDIYYHIEKQAVIIGERRPVRNGVPGEMTNLPLARIAFNRCQKAWRLYWLRGKLQWECCDAAYNLSEVLELVREDKYGRFWG